MPGEIRDELEAAFNATEEDKSLDGTNLVKEVDEAPETDKSDLAGRFEPKEPAKDPLLEGGEQEQASAEVKPTPPPSPTSRAPVSWSPEERQGWEAMSPAHQQAVLRREQEISRTLASTADARRFASEVQQALAPYMPMIQAEGGTPVRAIESVMQTAAILRTAPPMQRAQAVADLISQFNVDPQMLDAALVTRLQGGQPAQDPYAPIMQMIDQRMQPVQQFMSSLEQRREAQQQQIAQEAQQTLEEFAADPKNEFMADVADDMADILEMAAQRGRQMSLQDAYKRATMLHPEVSRVIEARKGQVGAAQQTAAARRARNAAVSVSGTGAPSGSSDDDEGDDVRSALSAAFRQSANRR